MFNFLTLLKLEMQKLILSFLNYLCYTKKVSRHTLKAYRIDLNQFFLNHQEKKINKRAKKQLENLIKESVENSQKKWHHLSPASQNRKLASIKSFSLWLFENNYTSQDLRFLFKSPKVFHKIPIFLSVDEIFAIIDELSKAHTNKEKDIERDQALFFLLYGGGLRVSEACHITRSQINWFQKSLTIKGKGGKERLISLPDKVMPYLKQIKGLSLYLFGDKPLSERKAYDIIKKWGQRANLLKPIHPHTLRHSFATHLLVGGSDIRTLQELMGHKTLSSTQRYTHLNTQQLSQTLDEYHPLNKG